VLKPRQISRAPYRPSATSTTPQSKAKSFHGLIGENYDSSSFSGTQIYRIEMRGKDALADKITE
jgi:hypothetical protein